MPKETNHLFRLSKTSQAILTVFSTSSQHHGISMDLKEKFAKGMIMLQSNIGLGVYMHVPISVCRLLCV